jgi:3-oxoacyl-ACP reductase-like protein
MGIFSTILEKLGLKKDQAASAPAAKPATAAPTATAAAPAAQPAASAKPAASVKPADPVFTPTANFHPNAISEVDVVKHLEKLSAGSNLDWKVSIVDLLKLLDIDSSREARNELAKELGCPADLMSDSAKMNVWLHKTVLQKIAENGGNIPQSLLS